jgi:manganese oxidase
MSSIADRARPDARRGAPLAQGAAIVLALSALTSPARVLPTTASGVAAVRMYNIAFLPQLLTVTPGTTITWTNEDGMVHTVTSGTTSDDAVWTSSPGIPPGGTFSVSLHKPGSYHYYCKLHLYSPAMHATIVVTQ